jgi:hypothetical protein
VFAIGDPARTGVSGARSLDCLFVTVGIRAGELGDQHAPNPEALKKYVCWRGRHADTTIGGVSCPP